MLRLLILAGLAAGLSASGAQAGTVDDVRARGYLNCGVSGGLPGFSFREPSGRWAGLDADTCRAVAAAVFGDAEKVVFAPLSAKERFTALQSGEVDLLARNTTWTLLRDTALDLNFAGVTYYDGQGFLVRRDLNLTTAEELDGAVVCVTLGTTTELNLANFSKAKAIELRPAVFATQADAAAAYEQGRCDAFTSDRSALAGFRSGFADPAGHAILPDIISKEPLGPVVRHGDSDWLDIVRWTVFALFQAEESGVSSGNIDEMTGSDDPTIQRLLGLSGDMGKQLGLANDWARQIIKQVGNYGEIYERSVGSQSPLGLERGLNAQWTDGGLMYAMPFR